MASFPIAETDNYVRTILSRAGKLPSGGSPEQLADVLFPHLVHQESGGNPNAVSKVGARGLTQLMPATARQLEGELGMPAGETDRNPEANLAAGKHYLTQMLRRYPGRPDLALAAYNAGPGRADKWAGIHPSNSSGDSPFRASAGVEDQVPLEHLLPELPTVDRRAEDAKGNFFSNVVGLDWSVGAASRIMEDAGQTVDPNFDIGRIPADQWKQITQGIPEEFQPALGSAVNMAHLQLLASRTRAQLQAEQELAKYGGWGIAGRFAVDMLDPLGLALAAASGGLGTLSKAGRLAEAVRAATAGGRLTEARTALEALETATRGGGAHMLKSAALAGTENAGLQAFLNQGNATRDGWDVAFAGLTGGLLGAAASKVFHGGQLADVRMSYLRAREELQLAELEHTLTTKRTALEGQLKWMHADGTVAQAQAELSSLEGELAGVKQRHLAALRTNMDAAAAARRQELAPVLARAENADNFRQQLASRVDQARQRVEVLQERVDGGDTSGATRASLAQATREMRSAEQLHDNHVARTAPQMEAAKAAKAELASLGSNDLAARERMLDATHNLLLKPARKRLAAAVAAREARKASLQDQLANLDKVRQAGVQASDKAIAEAAQAFGQDSASAARFMGFYEGVHPHLEEDGTLTSGLPKVAQMGAQGLRGKIVDKLMARRGPMATIGMVLRGSPNEKVRTLLGRMVGNSVGTKDGSATTVGGSEIAQILRQRQAAKFYSAFEPAYKDWAERNGHGMVARQTRPVREEFAKAVGRFVRGDEAGADPAVAKAAQAIRSNFDRIRQEARDAGVKGFEDLESRPNYLPRVFDFDRQYDIENRIGSDNLRLLTQRAILAANEDMPEGLAGTIARAYVRRMKELRVGSDMGLMAGMKWDDIGFLRQFLYDAGEGHEQVESVIRDMAALNARRERQTEGTFRNAKHRVQFDENMKMSFRDQIAAKEGRLEDIEVSLADLFENNVEHLFGRYNRTMAGHIGLAKVGMKSRKDFDESIRVIERELESDPKELERVKKTALVTYQLVTGQPIEDASTLTRLGRAARDWNFTTTMGQSGWAQFPDLAGLLQSGYIGDTIRHFPEVFGTARRDAEGRIDVPFYREQEEWVGLGTDLHNNQVFSAFDPLEQEGLEGALGKVEHGLRVGGRGVQMASGLGWMTSFSQRIVGRVIVQRLMKDVLDGGAIAEHRALQLGLTDAMKQRIAAQIKAHTEFVDGDFGGKVKILNYGAWTDVDAREAMIQAISREARRLVQEEDLGDTTLWMHKNWGKILTQFRRFAMVSYSKQLLHGIAHADAEEGTRLMVSLAFAAMAYQARHMVAIGLKEAGGATPEEIQQYKDKYLGLHRLAAASIANSTYSTLLPGLWDTVQYETTGTRSFDTRSSGLGSDLITGNPTYSLGKNFMTAVAGSAQAVTRGDKQFDQRDLAAWRRLMPFGNVVGMDLPFAAMNAGLPAHDQDADPKTIDWLFNDSPSQ